MYNIIHGENTMYIVSSIWNLKMLIKKQTIQDKRELGFPNVAGANVHALFAALQLFCEGVGKLLFGSPPGESSPLLLELLRGHGYPSKIPFQLWKKEKVFRVQVRGVGVGGRSSGYLFSLGTPPPAWQSGLEHCPSAVNTPQTPNLTFSSSAASGTLVALGICRKSWQLCSWGHSGCTWLPGSQKCQNHCLCPGGMGLCHYRPRDSILKPLLGMLLGLKFVHGHDRLVHSDDPVQDGLPRPPHQVN